MKEVDYLQFEDYLREELSYSERRMLEQQLLQEKDYNNSFLHYEQLRADLVYNINTKHAEQDLIHNLEEIGNRYILEKGFSIKRIFDYTTLFSFKSIAASIIIFLFLIPCTIYHAEQQYSNSALIASYKVLPSFSKERSGGSQALELTDIALLHFYKNHYDQVIETLESIDMNDANYVNAQYLISQALVEKNNLGPARNKLVSLLQIAEGIEKADIEWSLVMLNIQLNRISDARKYLSTIKMDTDHEYFSSAIELEQKLNSKWRTLTW